MKKISLLLFIVTFLTVSVFAQEQQNVKPALSSWTRHYLEQLKTTKNAEPDGYIYKITNSGQHYISAIIKVAQPGSVQEKLNQIGAMTGTKAGDIWTVQVPVDKVAAFTGITGISYIQLDEPVFPNLDIARKSSRVDSVHKGINLPMSYSGKNVVVGIIDFGFDYNHPTFMDTTGTKFRIKKVWELNGTGTPPAGYSYGRELADTMAIKAATTDNAVQTHGTAVAGMAAGSGIGSNPGNNLWRGMAYDADIVMVGVRRDKIESQWRQGGFSDFIDGISYIFTYADNSAKPAVVNISWGSQSGAHDGTSLFNQACNNLSGPGKIIVMSAGNEGSERIHLAKTFTAADTVVNTFLTFSPATYQRTWVDVWGEPGKTFCGRTTLYHNNTPLHTTGALCLDSNIHDMYLLGSNGIDTCYIQYINTTREPLNGKPRMTIQIFNKTTDTIGISVSGNSGSIHMWDEYYYYGYTNGFSSAFSSLKQPDAVNGDSISTVSDMGSAASVLLVGAYITKTVWVNINNAVRQYSGLANRLASFSSRGPMVDGRIKPDITAPGMTIATAVSSYDTAYTATGSSSDLVRLKYTDPKNSRDYYYAEFSGTSAASPAAAGIVALMLQVKPDLTPAQAKDVIFQTAILDTYTGALPPAGDNSWGHGKINAYGAVKMLVKQLGIYQYAGPGKLDCVLFPSPNDGNFVLDYTGRKAEPILIEVFNITGGLMAKETWQVNNGQNQRAMNLSHLSKGNYLVRVSGTEGAVTIKTVLK